MRRIDTDIDIAEGLDALVRLDPRLVRVRARAGGVPLRRVPPGFAALASIVVSQQVSRASAEAILGRLVASVRPLSARAVLVAGADLLGRAGLSRPKQAALIALAAAVEDGLDLDGLCALEAAEAVGRLTAVRGIGPWTAQVYLLSAAGHPDVFPAGDVALQSAVGEAFGIAPRPDARALAALAESWSPWRGVAARLFWSYYREMRGRDAQAVIIGG